jgi:fatty acid desaturase
MTTISPVRQSPARSPRGSAYAQLSKLVKDAGLLDRRPGYYTTKIILTLLAFIGAWLAFLAIGRSWWQLAVAALMAVTFTQVAFIGHDAGHKQIFRTRRANYLLGVALGNLGIGLSYGWWIDKHNRHPAHPNEVGKDPDIEPGVLVYTGWQARLRGRAGRLWSRLQAYMFFPLLLLEGLNLHVSSIRALASGTVRSRRTRRWRSPCSPCMSPATWPLCSCCSRRGRRSRSSPSTKAYSASTWAARSHPTTRECRY